MHGTIIESWYPLGHGDSGLLGERVFSKLGKKYGKTNAQIVLRWQIQEGNVIFPRAMNPVHIKENMEIFDFELTNDEMDEIKVMDRNMRFFNMSLEEQEEMLGKFKPAD